MTRFEILQIITVLAPLAERAFDEGRNPTQGELNDALARLDVSASDLLWALVDAKKAKGLPGPRLEKAEELLREIAAELPTSWGPRIDAFLNHKEKP